MTPLLKPTDIQTRLGCSLRKGDLIHVAGELRRVVSVAPGYCWRKEKRGRATVEVAEHTHTVVMTEEVTR